MKYRILISIVGVALWWNACTPAPSAESKPERVAVTVEKVLLQNRGDLVSLSGTVEPVRQSVISTRIMGQISRYLVHEGELVKAGQLLVSIRSNDIKAKAEQVAAGIAEAEAAFENAKLDYARFQALKASGSATAKELDDMTARYKMAEARLEAARKMEVEVAEMMDYAQIRAPYAGVVTQVFLNDGDMASPGMPLVAVEGVGAYEVKFLLPENLISKIEVGQEVSVEIPSVSAQLTGKIKEISPSRIHSGNQYQATAWVDHWNGLAVKSGMFARVGLVRGDEMSLMIDNKHLIYRGQLIGIWGVTADKKAILKWVRIGKAVGNQTEILSGLGEGDFWITGSTGRLYDGAPVSFE